MLKGVRDTGWPSQTRCKSFTLDGPSLRYDNVSEAFILSFFGVTKNDVTKNESQPGYFPPTSGLLPKIPFLKPQSETPKQSTEYYCTSSSSAMYYVASHLASS